MKNLLVLILPHLLAGCTTLDASAPWVSEVGPAVEWTFSGTSETRHHEWTITLDDVRGDSFLTAAYAIHSTPGPASGNSQVVVLLAHFVDAERNGGESNFWQTSPGERGAGSYWSRFPQQSDDLDPPRTPQDGSVLRLRATVEFHGTGAGTESLRVVIGPVDLVEIGGAGRVTYDDGGRPVAGQ